jgi:hypothetical protein
MVVIGSREPHASAMLPKERLFPSGNDLLEFRSNGLFMVHLRESYGVIGQNTTIFSQM